LSNAGGSEGESIMYNENSLLWNYVDKAEYLKKVRDHFDFDKSISDDEIIGFGEEYFRSYLEKYYVVAGNEMELRRIRRTFTALAEGYLYSDPNQPIIAEPDQFFMMTERLFREGFYIETCIAARFTIERLFHWEVKETPEFGAQIRGNQRNPQLKALIDFLRKRDGWSDDIYKKVMKIKEYGDWQLHHRFDKMYEGMGQEDFKWAVADAKFGIEGVKTEFNEWLTHIQIRWKQARELAFESMRYLYEIMVKYRERLKKVD
jgi:hypothetical protein